MSKLFSRHPFIFVFCIILLGLLLRGIEIAHKQTLSHDESISYLSATVNQGAYQKVQEDHAYPFGVWVQASEWKQLLAIQEPFAFAKIGRELAQFDIHPPLYFWLLHLWTLIFGVHPWTGPTLNVVVFSGSVAALFALAKLLLKNNREALMVCLIWTVSPAVLDITVEARQYELLGFCTIFFAWSMLRYANSSLPHSWLKWGWLIVSVLLGALTHYHFALVVVGMLFILFVQLLPVNRSRFFSGLVGVGVGYLIFFVLHPQFYLSLQQLASRQGEEVQRYWTWLDFLRRVYATGYAYTRFWVNGDILQVAVFCLLVSSAIWMIWKFLRNPKRSIYWMRQAHIPGIEAVCLFLWIAAVTIFLYLTLLSPGNAMTTRHMSLAWPFFAFVPVSLLHLVKRRREWWQWAVVLVVMLSGLATVYFDDVRNQQVGTAVTILQSADYIVVDNVHRGIFPRIFWQIPDETLIYAADQSHLTVFSGEWMPFIQSDATASYVSNLSYTNSADGQDRIISLLSSEKVAVDGRGQYAGSFVYQLRVGK